MSTKPILFNTEMVRAILDGRKTQTRRIVNNDWIQSAKLPIATDDNKKIWHFWNSGEHKSKYEIDDVLYVRETFGEFTHTRFGGTHTKIIYKADGDLECRGVKPSNSGEFFHGWKPSIHMPKEYARIFLKITDVRVEKLQDINCYEIEKEGFKDLFQNTQMCVGKAEDWWINLWNSTAKDGYKWEDNPYVFVYEFERVEK